MQKKSGSSASNGNVCVSHEYSNFKKLPSLINEPPSYHRFETILKNIIFEIRNSKFEISA